jgi:hypothetical protein
MRSCLNFLVSNCIIFVFGCIRLRLLGQALSCPNIGAKPQTLVQSLIARRRGDAHEAPQGKARGDGAI